MKRDERLIFWVYSRGTSYPRAIEEGLYTTVMQAYHFTLTLLNGINLLNDTHSFATVPTIIRGK